MADILVCRTDELGDGDVRIVSFADSEIGVIRHAGQWYTYRNICPHQGGPACEGVRMFATQEVIGNGGVSLGHIFDETDMHIVCPWHGYEFHLDSGVHVRDDRIRLQRFPVFEKDDKVYLSLRTSRRRQAASPLSAPMPSTATECPRWPMT